MRDGDPGYWTAQLLLALLLLSIALGALLLPELEAPVQPLLMLLLAWMPPLQLSG